MIADLWRHDRRRAHIATAARACAGNSRADTGEQGHDRRRLCRCELLAQALEMAAREMSGLVRKYADDLVRGLGVEQRAGIDEDVAAVHDKGVERTVAENDDPDILLGQSRRTQNRLCIVAQQLFDLGVADNRHAARRAVLRAHRRDGRSAAGSANRNRGEKRDRPGCWRLTPRPDRCAAQGHPDFLPDWRETSDAP